MMLVSSVLWLTLAGLVTALRCPGGQDCADGGRCCELPGGGSACCPQGVERSLPMVKAGSRSEASGKLCPGNVSCPLEYSCLRAPAGSYSCCPLLEQAVSCADGRHCCPWGALCSLDGKLCLQRSESNGIEAIICPGGELECPDQTTCCLTMDGSWGCCPLPQAVCCEDKAHCCPHGTTCDLPHAKCLSADGDRPLWSKFPARKRTTWKDTADDPSGNGKCRDGSSCPDWTTCCQQKSSKFGCCPMANAVCCTDQIHCCPEGTTCDLTHSMCVDADGKGQSQMLTRVLALPERGKDVKCDETQSCPDGHTCCRLPSGEWGCCPYVEAVCCSDRVHCCPKGYKCNTAVGTCEQSALPIPWTAKIPARARETLQSEDVRCDDEASCADGQTCCRTASGEWGCCPLPEAVCCSDHVHCCAKGYTCNTAAGSCEQSALSIPWTAKTPAQARESVRGKDVKCDDKASCADGQTCCKTESGYWACCPLLEAVCCSDHVHCCPKGYTCNTAAGSCEQSALSIPWTVKTPAQARESVHGKDVKCDEETSCADGQTCCRTASGEWACCPLTEAVCCSDHVHCCPNGYTCNTAVGSCDQGILSIPWTAKTPAQGRESVSGKDVKCDDTASCADGQTCCRMASGEWACCPLPEAVCCSDHVHCCPKGYTCNTAKGSCEQGGLSIPWTARSLTQVRKSTRSTDVKCDDEASCADGQTCCRTSSGEWACCQLPSGICCKDRRHCCPAGYKCSLTGERCIRSKVLRWDENVSTKRQQLDVL
ncbi:progranulin isoform X2 [Rhinatrema bivittatum]|uniref:progranulin isoform X2 n=1 Tax=Rhinatrema bivittatum TaxID=194408 RepID=UPI0011275DC1|nr:progranulin isoform X2 [Rhinatrema bivittatum]